MESTSTFTEVDLNRTPLKAVPNRVNKTHERLLASPKTLHPSTPEKSAKRQEEAELRRKALTERKVRKAKEEVDSAKKKALDKKLHPEKYPNKPLTEFPTLN
eukprot:TRINITY_DN6283_c0_g1_i1.p1 TRINITY_DN6283_c0_g1~~TRINITY_DN6283_c0_g1_i1.p1  ORF type:complete len:102 (+),score=19.57 TRINITY_DN6283_c0_g1_i1:82-387(+)